MAADPVLEGDREGYGGRERRVGGGGKKGFRMQKDPYAKCRLSCGRR